MSTQTMTPATTGKAADVALPIRQIAFTPVPPPGSITLAAFPAPWQCHAVLTDERLFRAEQGKPSGLSCIILDSQIATATERKAALAWIHAQPAEGARRLKANFRNAKVILCGDRALLLAPVDLHAPLLKALADFRFLEQELCALEGEINADWERVGGDITLANDVKSEDLKRLDELNAMTCTVFQRRIRLARLELPLLNTQLHDQPGIARALSRVLREKMEVEQRLETLDGQLEVYEYVYEMVSQRMGEYRAFRYGFIIEVLIVILLAAEVTIMLWSELRT